MVCNHSYSRGNYEELDYKEINWMDPMSLDGAGRDWFPKKNLHDGWIGDRYPLCSDMPSQAFLKAGATYKLLGASSQPRYHFEREDWDGNESIKRMTLHSGSTLHGLLCAESGGECTYPTVVTLQDDISCHGMECGSDTLRVVQVSPNVFYEYVRVPCVQMSFLDNAKTVFAGNWGGYGMCGDPAQPIATTTCCPTASGKSEISCNYHGEQVNYDTNMARCANEICPAGTDRIQECNECCETIQYSSGNPKYNKFQWTEGDCSYQVKVRLDAMVAIVHVPETSRVVQYVQNSVKNMNFFHIPWPTDQFLGDEIFPNIDNQCGNGTCVEQEDWTCLCDVAVTNSAAFSSHPLDADTIRSTLNIGAFHPASFGSTYASGTPHPTHNDIIIYHLASVNDYSQDTIFELNDEFGVKIYLKNQLSMIQIGNDVNDYFVQPLREPLTVRNPLSFFDLVKPETRDAYYETEAVIDHLISHPNAAPFIAKQLIQHIGGISNPSPLYVENVATAFAAGTYESTGITFGEGVLSDLTATVAAILLDREATSVSLDADPSYGGIKEPLVKVIQFMRAMGYTQTAWDRNIYPKLYQMVDKVGQMVHESPDQFSFFLPDYLPPGQFAQSSLFAPAAQVLTFSTTIGTVEGLFSMVRNGLSSSGGGFGRSNWGWGALEAGDYSESVGYLDFSPTGTSDQQVQQIAGESPLMFRTRCLAFFTLEYNLTSLFLSMQTC